jgi:hypothetical protein
VHGLEGKEGATTFLPCSEVTTEKMDGGDIALAVFGGGGELGQHSGDRGGVTMCGRCFGRVCGCVAGAKRRAGARARL